MEQLADLNQRFTIPNQVAVQPGPHGLPVINITNEAATAAVCLHGGHVLQYQPMGSRPLLWLSQRSHYETGKPIRGGIPLCWPWFGAHPTQPELPAHGLARILPWDLEQTQRIDTATTRLQLVRRDSASTRRLWDHPFLLRLSITVGESLEVTLEMQNTGDSPWRLTSALHTYFSVSDVRTVSVHGFDGCPSIDTVGGARTHGQQMGPILVDRETDVILLDCPGDAWIDDPDWQRRIRIRKQGSASAVVWNPWIEKAKRMPDFGDDEYPGMICVETTNAPGDECMVAPGDSHCLTANLAIET